MNNLVAGISPEDYVLMRGAYQSLEHPSLAARLTSVVGTPFEMGLKLLNRRVYRKIYRVSEVAIQNSLHLAISSMRRDTATDAREPMYKIVAAGLGAMGGFFGLPALLIELPVTTTIMLRSIAEIARMEGEDLDAIGGRLACMEVFALGGRTKEDDSADTGYYGIRIALAMSVSSASRHISRHGLTSNSAPALARLITAITARFGVAISDKAAAQMLPLVGAAGGAALNTIFMQHFQDVARAHFTVRRLERKYGETVIKHEYQKIGMQMENSAESGVA